MCYWQRSTMRSCFIAWLLVCTAEPQSNDVNYEFYRLLLSAYWTEVWKFHTANWICCIQNAEHNQILADIPGVRLSFGIIPVTNLWEIKRHNDATAVSLLLHATERRMSVQYRNTAQLNSAAISHDVGIAIVTFILRPSTLRLLKSWLNDYRRFSGDVYRGQSILLYIAVAAIYSIGNHLKKNIAAKMHCKILMSVIDIGIAILYRWHSVKFSSINAVSRLLWSAILSLQQQLTTPTSNLIG